MNHMKLKQNFFDPILESDFPCLKCLKPLRSYRFGEKSVFRSQSFAYSKQQLILIFSGNFPSIINVETSIIEKLKLSDKTGS